MVLFTKKLEKIYLIKYEESNNNVKNLLNTDFNDNDWDMDALNDSESNNNDDKNNNNVKDKGKNNNNEDIYKIKYINIDYNNLIMLCLRNTISFGSIFTPVMNIFLKINKMGIKKLPILMKNNIKNILKGRIILDY